MIRLIFPYGIVVRKACLAERGVTMESVRATVEQGAPHHEDEELFAIGPIWPEAVDIMIKRLQDLGLEYWDDFMETVGDYPDWLGLHGEHQDQAPEPYGSSGVSGG